MTMCKRLMAILCALLMLCALCGCNNDEKPGDVPAETVASTETEAPLTDLPATEEILTTEGTPETEEPTSVATTTATTAATAAPTEPTKPAIAPVKWKYEDTTDGHTLKTVPELPGTPVKCEKCTLVNTGFGGELLADIPTFVNVTSQADLDAIHWDDERQRRLSDEKLEDFLNRYGYSLPVISEETMQDKLVLIMESTYDTNRHTYTRASVDGDTLYLNVTQVVSVVELSEMSDGLYIVALDREPLKDVKKIVRYDCYAKATSEDIAAWKQYTDEFRGYDVF